MSRCFVSCHGWFPSSTVAVPVYVFFLDSMKLVWMWNSVSGSKRHHQLAAMQLEHASLLVGRTVGPIRASGTADRESGSSGQFLAYTAATPTRDPRLHSNCGPYWSGAHAGPQVEASQDAACLRNHLHSSGGLAGAQQGPSPIPAPRRRAVEQLPGPPPAHSPHQP